MVITVSHQKGGVGKSTLAFNIAVELSKKYKVEMVDLDVQQTVSTYNVIRSSMDQAPIDVHVFSNDKQFVDYVNNIDDSVIAIVDSGGFDSSLNRIAILISDFILTPVSTEFTEIMGLEKYQSILSELQKTTDNSIITNVVLNKVSPNQKNFDNVIDFVNKSPYFRLMDSILRRRVDFANSVAYGFTVNELDIKSDSSKEMSDLIKEIEEKVGLNG
ncbi:MAG: ParA family protein [Campylobacterales bacterium]|nr:ParA family protein [Campylobacterota bacterium]MBD3842117.1 ParA family protein [Campylobacterales bacterium]